MAATVEALVWQANPSPPVQPDPHRQRPTRGKALSGEEMYLRIAVIGFLAVASHAATASEVEHWACSDLDGRATVTWTIAENRMFVAKGKGALQVVSNSPSLTVAYDLHKIDGHVISSVYVLDKASRKLIVYDDANAVIFGGKFGIPFEPKVKSDPCELSK